MSSTVVNGPPEIDTLCRTGGVLSLPMVTSWVVNQSLSTSPSLTLTLAYQTSPSLIATDGIVMSPSNAETFEPSTYHSVALTVLTSLSASEDE